MTRTKDSTLRKKTAEILEKNGWIVENTQHWQSFANKDDKEGKKGVRKDFGGFADMIAWDCDRAIAIQVTTRAQRKAHYEKILGNEKARRWDDAPSRGIELWCWRKQSNGRWEYRAETVWTDAPYHRFTDETPEACGAKPAWWPKAE